MSDDLAARVRPKSLSILSDHHYILRRAEFSFRRNDGTWQEQVRESYDIGDGAAVLPLDPVAGTVLLLEPGAMLVEPVDAGDDTRTVDV